MDICNILVVEDDPDINKLLCRILEGAGYACRPAFSGSEAALWAGQYEYDLVLLDLMLPGLTGEEFIAQMRQKKTMPIIVLSAKAGLEDRVNVLRLGADDFIPKPFDNAEVLARVEAQLRRYKQFSGGGGSAVLTHGDLTLDREKVGDLLVADGRCDVLALEEVADFLVFHMEQAGRVKLKCSPLPLDRLEPPAVETRTIRDTVSSLRLDAVAASGFSLSRGKAADLIASGRVQLNHRECVKPDHAVAQGDVLSCRGLGKCVLTEVGGPSKKGRILIVLERYV